MVPHLIASRTEKSTDTSIRGVTRVMTYCETSSTNVVLDLTFWCATRKLLLALLMPDTVDGGTSLRDNVAVEHLRGGHLDVDPGCTTCTSMTMRGRRAREEEFVSISRVDCRDTCWLH